MSTTRLAGYPLWQYVAGCARQIVNPCLVCICELLRDPGGKVYREQYRAPSWKNEFSGASVRPVTFTRRHYSDRLRVKPWDVDFNINNARGAKFRGKV